MSTVREEIQILNYNGHRYKIFATIIELPQRIIIFSSHATHKLLLSEQDFIFG